MTSQIEELALCAHNGWHFLTTHAQILTPDQAIVPFEPWEHLHNLYIVIQDNDRVIVLKARQIGVSWLIAGIAVWYVLFKPGANVLMFSRREDEAARLLLRSRFIWSHLPDFLRQPLGKDNEQELTFPAMDSSIHSFPSTPGSGRMESSTLVLMDEWAFQPYARENYAGILPTVEKGKLVGVSTANGKANLFAETWSKARRGENSFRPIFIPYTARPGRTSEWREQQKRDMPAYLALQEYPGEEKEAFIVAGTCMFSVSHLQEMPLGPPVNYIQTAEVYAPYDKDHLYVAGVDTALGIKGRDYSCLSIIDATSGEQAVRFHTQMPIEQFSETIPDILIAYGSPMVCIEEQPQGRIVAKALFDRRYPKHRIYHRSANIPCWHTSERNRRQILSELEVAIRTGGLRLHCEATRDEFLSFGYNEDTNKFEALSGHDDEVMSLALGWHMLAERTPPMTDFTPKTLTIKHRNRGSLNINWRKSDPFKDIQTVPCPRCAGQRIVPDRVGHRPCPHCKGLGIVLEKRDAETS